MNVINKESIDFPGSGRQKNFINSEWNISYSFNSTADQLGN